MAYQPFLIASAAGMQTGLEPWKIPADAFSEFDNVFIEKGYIKKRRGLAPFVDTGNGNPIIGIFFYIDAFGERQQLVCDNRRLYRYEASSGTLVDLDGADVLTGTGTDFLSWENYLANAYMVNDIDPIRVYDGTTVSNLSTGAVLDTAAYVKVLQERLIVFNTLESGNRFPQRVRWCAPGDPTDWTGTGSGDFDLPTSEHITGVTYLRNKIIIWCEGSCWLLEYTNITTSAFRPIKLDSTIGCRAPYSAVARWDLSFAFDKVGVVYTDGHSVRRLDETITDFFLTFNTEKEETIYGQVYEERDQIVWLYPVAGSDEANRLLWFNYNLGIWGTETYTGFNCIGFFPNPSFETWDEQTGTWDEWDEPWDSVDNALGYPIFFAGTTAGEVLKLNTGTNDDGASISMDLTSARWNPFKKQGVKCRLGYIDFLVSNLNSDFYVDFLMNFETTPYATQLIDCSEIILSKNKDWVRAYPSSGAIADTHQINIRNDAVDKPVEIHALILWMSPEGDIE